VNVSVAAVPPVLQYVMTPVVVLTNVEPFAGGVTTVTDAGLAASPVPVSVAPFSGLIVVHAPADTLPVWGCSTGAAGGELITVVAIGWNWYGACGHTLPAGAVGRQLASTAAGYPATGTLAPDTPREGMEMLAFVSNSLTVDTMLPVPVAVTSKLQVGRVSVPPAENWADPVDASRYGVEVPGPWKVVPFGTVAVQPGPEAVHSVTVNGPVVVTLLVSVNDQLPATMLPATKVD